MGVHQIKVKMKKVILAGLATLVLAACGGGGDSGGLENQGYSAYAAQLNGLWVYAGDGRTTGGVCGPDPSGGRPVRLSITFSDGKYTMKEEHCVVLGSGNTGAYFQTNYGDGSIVIGDIALTVPSDPNRNMRAIDFVSSTTYYTSYRIGGDKLYIGDPIGSNDGATPDKRAISVTYKTPVYVKQ